ncbi:MAG: flagellar hook-associated protein FlgK [Christensenellales bacterium]|jgi:flagellar hook-associated protein 1 FlgK
MAGIFYGLEIARRGLTVSQRAIQLTGHNVANADTEGYTRQRLVIESIYPQTGSRLSGNFAIGGGAEAKSVEQLRSAYIDRQLRGEYASLGEWSTRAEEMRFIESVLDETAKTGTLSQTMADFFQSVGKLTTDPDSSEVRTNMQQNAIKLCEKLNYYYEKLADVQNLYNDTIKIQVDEINNMLTSIASYNKEIWAYELNGQTASELRDRRNLLLDKLSQTASVTYSEDEEGRLSVFVEGYKLVDHLDAFHLETVPNKTGVVSGSADYYSVNYKDPVTGDLTEIIATGGTLKAYQDLRDGDSVDNVGVPYLMDQLNTLARSLAKSFNEVHEKGYTIPYGTGTSMTGVKLFDVPDNDYSKVTAGNFSLSAEVLANVLNIAASSKPVDLSGADTQKGNNENALALYALTSSTNIETVSNFQEFLKSFVVQVGISSASAQEMSKSQTFIVDNLETRREAISGVSIDEEMINLINFQYAYAAASRVLTAIDEALETLIMGTGVVGR